MTKKEKKTYEEEEAVSYVGKKYDIAVYFGTENEWKEETDEDGVDEDGNKSFLEYVGRSAIEGLRYCDEHEILWSDMFREGCPLCGIHDIINGYTTCEGSVFWQEKKEKNWAERAKECGYW
jgi:hypothetical protein